MPQEKIQKAESERWGVLILGVVSFWVYPPVLYEQDKYVVTIHPSPTRHLDAPHHHTALWAQTPHGSLPARVLYMRSSSHLH